ncbi:hypothetical protein DL764_002731 [Monosporascus ibericus]|uniref:Lipocalin-like domain-containing protein n=1 Tax=Monosporascus ibericus TaxID=155417 RepID=A0A4V1XBQ8_9PEZI|nr:hypothetical protein DL764_002731 [Monosporascus ibericus]
MAAPANKNIGDLNGKWVLNKTLSDPTDPALALQGLGWMLRTAIGLATITLDVKQYTGPPKSPSTSAEPATHVDIEQTVTGGVKGNTERRCLDWEMRSHSDYMFGSVRGQSRWVPGGDELARVVAEVEPVGVAYLKGGADQGEWLEDEAEGRGPGGETHILSFARNVDEGRGWIATQVWGFQNVGGERRYVRLVVVAKGEERVNMKMVYDYIPE